MVANFQIRVKGIPWMGSKLLQSESNALLVVIKVKDYNIDFLIQRYNLMRVAYTSPREVCYMDESVYAAKVNKYTI